MSKAILLEEQFRQALILWGREVSLLRKRIIEVSENYTNDVQLVLNAFKTQSDSLYGIQRIKYDKVYKSK
jgi:hypothetical protein